MIHARIQKSTARLSSRPNPASPTTGMYLLMRTHSAFDQTSVPNPRGNEPNGLDTRIGDICEIKDTKFRFDEGIEQTVDSSPRMSLSWFNLLPTDEKMACNSSPCRCLPHVLLSQERVLEGMLCLSRQTYLRLLRRRGLRRVQGRRCAKGGSGARIL